MKFNFLKTAGLTLLTGSLLLSCETEKMDLTETSTETTSSEKGAKRLTFNQLSLFNGFFTFESCTNPNADTVQIGNSLGENGELRLISFKNENVLENYSQDDEGVLRLEIDGYLIEAFLVPSNPNLDIDESADPIISVSFQGEDLCETTDSIKIDSSNIGSFAGNSNLPSCDFSNNGDLQLSINEGESGNLRLVSLNGENVFSVFTPSKTGKILIATGDDFVITAEIIVENGNQIPVIEATYKGVVYCKEIGVEEAPLNLQAAINDLFLDLNAQDQLIFNSGDFSSESLKLERLEDGKVALKASNGKYVSSENGSKPMTANRTKIGRWERFEMEELANGDVAFKANNGKYISSERGSKPATANRSNIGTWERFRLIAN